MADFFIFYALQVKTEEKPRLTHNILWAACLEVRKGGVPAKGG